MFAKIALTALIIGIVLFLTVKQRRRPNAASVKAKAPTVADDLMKCPSCGVYRLPDRPCDCG